MSSPPSQIFENVSRFGWLDSVEYGNNYKNKLILSMSMLYRALFGDNSQNIYGSHVNRGFHAEIASEYGEFDDYHNEESQYENNLPDVISYYQHDNYLEGVNLVTIYEDKNIEINWVLKTEPENELFTYTEHLDNFDDLASLGGWEYIKEIKIDHKLEVQEAYNIN